METPTNEAVRQELLPLENVAPHDNPSNTSTTNNNNTTNNKILNIAGYKFVLMNKQKVDEVWAKLKQLCKKYGLRGTIYIAPEGVNSFLTGHEEDVRKWMEEVRTEIKELSVGLDFKESWSQFMPFDRLLVRRKKEIIAMGVELDASDLHRALHHDQDQQQQEQTQQGEEKDNNKEAHQRCNLKEQECTKAAEQSNGNNNNNDNLSTTSTEPTTTTTLVEGWPLDIVNEETTADDEEGTHDHHP